MGGKFKLILHSVELLPNEICMRLWFALRFYCFRCVDEWNIRVTFAGK